MLKKLTYVLPEQVLARVYGKTSVELGMSENRRDEVIAAALFASFRNQEFGTRFKLPANYKYREIKQDAQGIDMIIANEKGRRKRLQIKGIHIQRSILRRRTHKTKGAPHILGRRSQRQMKHDSEELTQIMRGELKKIVHDYRGIFLVIHVIADLATQTSLEIAIRKSQRIVEKLKAQEVWFIRNIPVRAIRGKQSFVMCYTYQLLKVAPDKRTYTFSFSL